MHVDDTLRQLQRTSVGALMFIGLGSSLLAHNVMPVEQHDSTLHTALLLAAFAFGLGAIAVFADTRRRFVRMAATFFGSIALVAFIASEPWQWTFGFGVPLWPVLVIAVGLWLAHRERHLSGGSAG
jgi:uncharacterized membrane protein